MNPVFPAQKRAEEFSSMVEGTSTTTLRDTGKYPDLVPLVGLVTSLRATPAPEARPEFVAGLRERLMLAAETALVPDTAAQVEARRQPAARRTSREKKVAAVIGGFALVSASASMSVAAQTALPGDTLYPLKRALENIHEQVLRSADDKGATMLDNASGRLDEVDELSRSGGQDPEVIAQTLQDFSDQAVEASDVLLGDYERTGRLSSIAELRSFTASSLEALERLESVVPAEVRSVLVHAKAVLDEIDRQALSLCPTCSDLPAVGDAANAADIGPMYKDILDSFTKGSGSGTAAPSTPKKPRSTTTSAEPVTPSTDAPTAPTAPDDQDPAGLTPPSEGSDDDSGPRSSISTVISGLGNGDLGDLLTGIDDTVDDVLGTGDEKKSDK